jgi:tetratricopeptide (TPR) repeat protein
VLTFGSIFFLLNIVTVIGIIPLAGNAIAADRYTYIPSIGIFFIVAAGFYYLYKKKNMHAGFKKYFLLLIMITVLGTFSILTWQRCKVWKDDMTLWQDALSKYPSSVAYNGRGLAFYEIKQYDTAVSDFIQALRLDPDFATAYYNRGNAYDARKDYGKAIADYSKAIGYKPNEYKKAIHDFTQAVRIDSTYTKAYNNRGMMYGRLGENDQAISDFTRAVYLDPNYAKAYYNRAITYFVTGEYFKALEDVTRSKELGYNVNPDFIKRLRYLIYNQ